MIRPALIEDVAGIAMMGRDFHANSIYAQFHYDDLKVANYIATVIEAEEGIVFVSVDEDGKINGAIMGWLSDHWFGDDTLLCDLAFYVAPSARGGFVAARLLKKFIEYGEYMGASQIQISNSSGYNRDRIGLMFERLGMQHVGYVFAHNKKE